MKLNQAELGLGGGSLLQVAGRSEIQMMSYIITTPAGETVIIDGGYYYDAENLYQEIKRRGGKVKAWFFTHLHCDHVGALTEILDTHPQLDIEIEALYFHFPDRAWLATKEGTATTERFYATLGKHDIPVVTPCAGDVYDFGGVSVEIVSHPVAYQNYPKINPTSMILRIHFPKRDVLILGDFDVIGQEEFLAAHGADCLRCDIVQLSHHAQNGPDRAFYELIAPKVCLYPTPVGDLKYYNEKAAKQKADGLINFALYDTWQWMEELGVTESYSYDEGDWLFT